MDRKTLENIFQGIISKFAEMKPSNLCGLEDETLNDMHEFGKALIQWKLQQWNTQLRQETCCQCGTNLENRLRSTQLSTWVADIDYARYRSNCTNCGNIEYPLDEALGLQPRQQYSSSVQELAALCGASWKYDECQYVMKKILRRQCVSHETVFNKTTEIGAAASRESEGNRIKALEGDKKLQGEHYVQESARPTV